MPRKWLAAVRRNTGMGRSRSAFQQLLDAALELALFQLALAQPFRKVGAGQFVGGFRAERDTHEIIAPPDDLGEKGTTLSRDRQQNRILRQPDIVAEFQMGAVFGNVAHHAISRRATFANLGDPAVDDPVARALASVQHRKAPNREGHFYAAFLPAEARERQNAGLT